MNGLRIIFVFFCMTWIVFAEQAPRPNIVIIVADDLGWADVGYHGSDIKTPHIDRLCREGVELDQHYVAPMCTPTRVGLLTGRYWSRFGNTTPSNARVLPWDTVTLAGMLKDHGYDTAMAGKWHLGSKPEWGGRKFGFNETYGSLAGGVNPWNHLYKEGPYSKTWHRNDVLIEEEGHVTDLIEKEAIRFIEKKRESPFFLYLPFTAVHTPFDEPQKWLDSARHVSEDRRQYVACAQHLDHSIGQIVQALERTQQLEETIILFFSDNGGTNGDDSVRYPDTKKTTKINGLNHPLRGWKKEVFDGGVRVPAFIYWKNQLTSKKVSSLLHCTDWMPTFAHLLKIQPEHDLKWDGENIWSHLTSHQAQETRRSFYWHGVGSKSFAYRQGDWKLIWLKGKEDKKYLFNMSEDPHEKHNLATDYPERVDELSEQILKEKLKDFDAVPK